ncbi:hypothetical protein [Pseudolysinimonas sp.]|uniref:hypothetical protein n=1 Tax=Pseudolysinimonas sp. TaxID=2680009 RepID=UPI003F807430
MGALNGFWAHIDDQLRRIREEKPDTFEKLKEVLDPPSSGDAFFAGSGGDDQLGDAMSDAGWMVHWQEGDYLWVAHHPITGAQIEYVEGDVYDRTPR